MTSSRRGLEIAPEAGAASGIESGQPAASEARELGLSGPATPLLDLPDLADELGVAQILVKDESQRYLGSFKSLGGTYAGVRALARAVGEGFSTNAAAAKAKLPPLLCASDGNHGLAVAAGARSVGAPSRIYLPVSVPEARARRIRALGGEIVWVRGTYDDAVEQARRAAEAGDGLLIADTSDNEDDPVVQDVMAGYAVMASELSHQLLRRREPPPTHLFVQAGVGGLAAALAAGIREALSGEKRIVVVEPEKAACVIAGLRSRAPVSVGGDLETSAEMLSCGKASAPALKVLLNLKASGVAVSEKELDRAPATLLRFGGPPTTPSGAAGCAGLIKALTDDLTREDLGLRSDSRILLIVTEGLVPIGDAE